MRPGRVLGRNVDMRHPPPMVTRKRTYGNPAVVFPCLLGSSIDARQYNAFVSSEYDGQYGRTHDISNRLVLVAKDTEWVQLYPLGTINYVVRPDWVECLGSVLSSLPDPFTIAMSCFQ
ncbi:Uncharacterized protein HZ326_29219 [Fusarium oxysporum f. sp. albedinis]|nr:Uncharacterized protein HZ326_29219 [Fusarium oxysporum f. sp. albedinis]